MKIIVDTKNYTPCKYDEFTDGTTKPGDSPYVVGQVVVINDGGETKLGVVLGCIGHEAEELRTDMCGMVSYNQIRPANIKDFGKRFVKSVDRLRKEVQGFIVSYNWDTYEETIEDANPSKTICNNCDGVDLHLDEECADCGRSAL